jgi:hypothetical protein
MRKPYAPPTLRELGSLRELTEQHFNKHGHQPDMYSHTHPHGAGGSLSG